MAINRTAVIFENREYFYDLKSESPMEIVIEMYSTIYIIVKDKNGQWVNHLNNRNQLSKGLLLATVEAINTKK